MRRVTILLLLLVLTLLCLGLLTVYSVSAVRPDGAGILKHHLFYLGVGLACLFITRHLDYHCFGGPRLSRMILLISLALLVLVFVPGVGVEVNGAQRWISILGFRFQPSEFAKLAVIVILAIKLAENQEKIRSFRKGFVPPLATAGCFALLILLERDLGMPVVIMGAAFLMIFVAGARPLYVVGSLLPAVAGVLGLVVASPYRLRRLSAFLDPWSHRGNEGFHLVQSLAAFARGGLWGLGPGAGQQKLYYLPAAHTDFIFAVWAEEMGLIGTISVVALFCAVLALGIWVAMHARDLFGSLLAAGIVSLITLQAVLNIAVTTGMMPTKGLPLPFISYGGSALIVFLTLVGILLNIGLQAQGPQLERRLASAR